jgi:predicted NBD/HSP70 family sugar kinase
MQSAHLREHNLSQVMRAVATTARPLSRADLAKATSLTKPTISKLVEELLAARLVVEDAPVSGVTGRPRVPLRPAAGTVAGIGLEVGADRLSGLAVDLTGQVLARAERALPVPTADPAEVIRACGALVGSVRSRIAEGAVPLPLAGVRVAIPGRLTPDGGTVLSAPNLGWSGVPFIGPFCEYLAAHEGLTGIPVQAQNDNRLSVLTEIDRRPGDSFLYVRGSTGVGGAVVLGGTILPGVHGWAGEFGHTVVVPDGEQCRCGRLGCLEAYISRHALRERAGVSADVPIDEVVDLLARRSDRTEVITGIGRPLGIAIANALNVLDLDTVVLSGYLAPIAEEISPVVRETILAHALAVEAGPLSIDRSDDLAEPALRGAARAALEPILASPGAWIGRVR